MKKKMFPYLMKPVNVRFNCSSDGSDEFRYFCFFFFDRINRYLLFFDLTFSNLAFCEQLMHTRYLILAERLCREWRVGFTSISSFTHNY